MGFFGATHGWWGEEPPSLKLTQIFYNDEPWHCYILPKENPKKLQYRWHVPWILLTSVLFHRKSAILVLSENIDIDCILIHNF